MQRFILEQFLARFRKILAEEADRNLRQTLRSMIFSTQRELAFFNSNSSGIGLPPPRFGPAGINRDGHHGVSQFQREFENSPHFYLVLDPRPGLHIIDVNDAYARATMTTRAVVAGERLFNVFPDNPDPRQGLVVAEKARKALVLLWLPYTWPQTRLEVWTFLIRKNPQARRFGDHQHAWELSQLSSSLW